MFSQVKEQAVFPNTFFFFPPSFPPYHMSGVFHVSVLFCLEEISQRSEFVLHVHMCGGSPQVKKKTIRFNYGDKVARTTLGQFF